MGICGWVFCMVFGVFYFNYVIFLEVLVVCMGFNFFLGNGAKAVG